METLKIEVSKKGFSFEADGSTLHNVVSKTFAVAASAKGDDSQAVCLLVASNKNVFVVSHASDHLSAFHLKGSVASSDGAFMFEPKILQGLIKGRGEMLFDFNGSVLNFKLVKGKYSGSFETAEVPTETIVEANREFASKYVKGTSISGELLSNIRSAIKACSIQNLFDAARTLECKLRAANGVLEVSAADTAHCVLYRAKIDKAFSFQMALSSATFNIVDKFVSAESEDAAFVFDSKRFVVEGETYRISLPPVQMDEREFNMVRTYISHLKEPVASYSFKEQGVNTIKNMVTISDEESRIHLEVVEKGVKVAMQNSKGQVSDQFKTAVTFAKGTKNLSVLIDPRVFTDLMTRIPEKEIEMRMFKSSSSSASSAFMFSAETKTTKLYLVGSYYEK